MPIALRIGLVNNMADAALKATERQFISLLDSAAHGIDVQLSLYALPEIPRTRAARRHIESFYRSATCLLDTDLDGLIVTGREPRTPDMRQEPYWHSLAKLIDWAGLHTHSAIWSCLAAHAAILHLDGIERRRLSEKRFGVLECKLAERNPLTAGVSSCFSIPHSRWHDVSESDLTSHGYSVLSRDNNGGVDAFLKPGKSLFLFFQGHPEYETRTLLREYRRDVRNKQEAMPFGSTSGTNTWCAAAGRIYTNWLNHICAKKEQARRESLPTAAL